MGTRSAIVVSAALVAVLAGGIAITAIAGSSSPGTVFHAIDPVRAFDSRVDAYAASGLLAPNQSKVISVKDGHDFFGSVTTPDAVPPGATAVAYNLTITGATGPNFVSVTPGDATLVTTSAINFDGSADIANAGIVTVDAARQIKVWNGIESGSVHVLIDITGYFALPDTTTTTTPPSTTTTSSTTTSSTTTSTTSPGQPPDPGDTVDCGDFTSQAEAQAWYDFYFPFYGDVANLDADDDGEACEGLPGDEIALRTQVDAGDSEVFEAPASWRVFAFRFDTGSVFDGCAFGVNRSPSGNLAEFADVESLGIAQMREAGEFFISDSRGGCVDVAITNGASHLTSLPVTVRESDSLPFDAPSFWTVSAVRESGSGTCSVGIHRDADGSLADFASIASGNSVNVTESGRFYLSPSSEGCAFTAAG